MTIDERVEVVMSGDVLTIYAPVENVKTMHKDLLCAEVDDLPPFSLRVLFWDIETIQLKKGPLQESS